MRHPVSARRFGILIHGRKIWISELLSIATVIVLSICFFLLSGKIVANELATYRLTEKITGYKADRILFTHYLEELKDRVAITELLCSIAGHRLEPGIRIELSDIIYTNSTKFGYDPLLLLAVIEVESVFDPAALGRYRNGEKSGAFGLMQLKHATAQEMALQLGMDSLTAEDLFKPEINVILGAAYLTTMIERFQSFKLGILAYNQGPGVISRQLTEKTPLSVRYYQKVLTSYYRFKQNSERLAAIDKEEPLCR